MLVMPWVSAVPASRSPSVPSSMTAGRQPDPWPAMLRTDSRQAALPAVPAANALPPGGRAELSTPAGGGAEDVPAVPGAAGVRAAAGRAAGLPVWADTAMAAAAAPAISPDAAAAQRRVRIARPRRRTAHRCGRGRQGVEVLVQPLAEDLLVEDAHWLPAPFPGALSIWTLLVFHGAPRPGTPSASAALARSLASAREAWLRTVPSVQPSAVATWASLRSSQYRSTTIARCRAGSSRSADSSAERWPIRSEGSATAVSGRSAGSGRAR